MESLIVIPDLEVQGFKDGEYAVREYDGYFAIGGMSKGTENGKPVVMIAMEDRLDGVLQVSETTLALFLTAADVFKAKYGDPR
jgi:hypothetical protein